LPHLLHFLLNIIKLSLDIIESSFYLVEFSLDVIKSSFHLIESTVNLVESQIDEPSNGPEVALSCGIVEGRWEECVESLRN